MTRLSPDARRMVEALREDRMNDRDRARLRARVVGVGAAVSASAAAAGVSQAKAAGSALAGTATAAKVSAVGTGVAVGAVPTVLGKLTTVGIAWKVGVATLVVAGALPLVHQATRVPEPVKAVATLAPSRVSSQSQSPSAQVHVARAPASAPSVLPSVGEAPVLRPTPEAAKAQAVERANIEPVGRRQGSASPVATKTVRAQKPSVLTAPPEVTHSLLGRESALIESALRALRDGDRDGARRLLDEHAATFPHGALAPERERTRERLNAPAETRAQ